MLVKKKTKKRLKNEFKKIKKIQKLKFSMKSLTFLRFICALNLYFAQKLLRKAKFVRGC